MCESLLCINAVMGDTEGFIVGTNTQVHVAGQLTGPHGELSGDICEVWVRDNLEG